LLWQLVGLPARPGSPEPENGAGGSFVWLMARRKVYYEWKYYRIFLFCPKLKCSTLGTNGKVVFPRNFPEVKVVYVCWFLNDLYETECLTRVNMFPINFRWHKVVPFTETYGWLFEFSIFYRQYLPEIILIIISLLSYLVKKLNKMFKSFYFYINIYI